MKLSDRVIKVISGWLAMAEKGEISYEHASILINTFELGLSEFAEATNNSFTYRGVSQKIADVNALIRSLGFEISYPIHCQDKKHVKKIEAIINSSGNLNSRRVHKISAN